MKNNGSKAEAFLFLFCRLQVPKNLKDLINQSKLLSLPNVLSWTSPFCLFSRWVFNWHFNPFFKRNSTFPSDDTEQSTPWLIKENQYLAACSWVEASNPIGTEVLLFYPTDGIMGRQKWGFPSVLPRPLLMRQEGPLSLTTDCNPGLILRRTHPKGHWASHSVAHLGIKRPHAVTGCRRGRGLWKGDLIMACPLFLYYYSQAGPCYHSTCI